MKLINQRKDFLINKKFQLSIVSWFSVLTIFVIGIFYFNIWYFFYNFKREASAAGLPTNHVFFQFINEQQYFMNKVFIITASIAFIILLLGGLYLSHKVAGPLARLTQFLRSHSKSDAPKLTFRKDDYFIEIEDAFNQFMDK